MKLYHFTRAIVLPGIREHGLMPVVGEGPMSLMTLRKPVVWLTSNGGNPPWAIDRPADSVRLTVNASPLRLQHWRTWLASKDEGAAVFAALAANGYEGISAEGLADWANHYVYFGTITPDRISETKPVVWGAPRKDSLGIGEDREDGGLAPRFSCAAIR